MQYHFRVHTRAVATSVLALAALVLGGCAGSPSTMAPAAVNSKMVYDLTLIIFGIAAVVFVAVEGMLLYSAIRFSRKGHETEEPKQIEGNTRLEIAWTLLPAIVLAIVFVISARTLFMLSSPSGASGQSASLASLGGVAPNQTMRIRVVGHQWWWEFVYPDLGVTTANEMHVPVGTRVDLQIESADVIHSFWVPQLAGKIDAIPGHSNFMWIQVTDAGRYHGQCAEFCGAQHALMRMEVVAESPDQFQAWVTQQQAPAAAVSGDAAKGQQAFMSGACIGCHTISNTNAQGKSGPNLTHIASRRTFAGGTYELNQDNLTKWLHNPQAMKPGTLMPNLNLPQDQIDALVAYLMSLK